VKLASELQKRSTGRTVYVLDEPTTGLHFEDIRKLLLVLESLVDKGNTVIVIEHNLDVIKTADWLIDMGPEGGHKGGTVVAAGTPEEVAEVADSHTGAFLRGVLGLAGEPDGNGARAATRARQANGTNGSSTRARKTLPTTPPPATPPPATAPAAKKAAPAKAAPAKAAPAKATKVAAAKAVKGRQGRN
jgi:excinuclease ABC subunit A